MRRTLVISAALLGLAATASAQTMGQTPDIRPGHVPGVGDSLPMSNRASNILPGDTRSPIAPTLPAPAGGQDAGYRVFLQDAERSLASGQTGRAQEALERAETARLQRSVPADMANQPDDAPVIQQLRMARDQLAHRDLVGARNTVAGLLGSDRS